MKRLTMSPWGGAGGIELAVLSEILLVTQQCKVFTSLVHWTRKFERRGSVSFTVIFSAVGICSADKGPCV